MTQDTDGRDRRPGVPMEHAPEPVEGAHWETITRQPGAALRRVELAQMTPVFGTACPPRGLSGAVRKFAYRIPEHRVTHWLALLAADRVDAIEHEPWRLWPLAAALGAGLGVRALRARARRRRFRLF